MHTEYLILDNCRKRKIIEQIREIIPNVWRTIFSHRFIVGSINLCHILTFMVTSKQCYTGWVFKLETKQNLNCLHDVGPSINHVASKKIFCLRRLSILFEDF